MFASPFAFLLALACCGAIFHDATTAAAAAAATVDVESNRAKPDPAATVGAVPAVAWTRQDKTLVLLAARKIVRGGGAARRPGASHGHRLSLQLLSYNFSVAAHKLIENITDCFNAHSDDDEHRITNSDQFVAAYNAALESLGIVQRDLTPFDVDGMWVSKVRELSLAQFHEVVIETALDAVKNWPASLIENDMMILPPPSTRADEQMPTSDGAKNFAKPLEKAKSFK